MVRQHFTVLLLFTTLSMSTNGQTDYTVYRTASTWMDASQACYLATPAINISTEGDYSVNIPNSDIQLTKGVNYWVGYHKSHRVFQYEGCATVPAGLTPNYILQPIPGQCFTACSLIAKTNYYGMRTTTKNGRQMVECYCLVDKPSGLLETQCTRSCIYKPTEHPFILCGGTNHISVYSSKDMGSLAMKVVDHPNAGFVGHCITYENIDQDSHEWFWTGCSRSLHPLCEQTTADGTRLLAEYKKKNENWKLSAQHCLNQGLYPATVVYEDRLKYERASLGVLAPSWTAMFRDHVVYIAWKENPLPGDQCAYIRVGEDNQAKMFFSQCLQAETMNYICQEGPTTDLHGHTTTNAVNSSPSFGSSTEGTPTNAKLQQGEISLVVPIVIGVVCGLIVIVAIIAIIVCVRKRNRHKHKDSETRSIPDLEHYTKNISMDYAIVDRLTNGEDNVDGYVNGNFNTGVGLVGNDQAPPPGDVVMDFRQTPDSPRILISPDYYDSLRTRSLKRRDTDNTYNKLNDKDHDGMYNNGNHAGKQNMKHSDDMYNKLESQNATDTYDRTPNAQKGQGEFANPGYDRALVDKNNTYNVTGGQDPDAVYSRVNKTERRID